MMRTLFKEVTFTIVWPLELTFAARVTGSTLRLEVRTITSMGWNRLWSVVTTVISGGTLPLRTSRFTWLMTRTVVPIMTLTSTSTLSKAKTATVRRAKMSDYTILTSFTGSARSMRVGCPYDVKTV